MNIREILINKDKTYFADNNLFFIKKIQDTLNSRGWLRCSYMSKNEIVCVIDEKRQYYQDTIDLLKKTFSDDNWDFSLRRYEHKPSTTDKNKKWHVYTFAITKKCSENKVIGCWR